MDFWWSLQLVCGEYGSLSVEQKQFSPAPACPAHASFEDHKQILCLWWLGACVFIQSPDHVEKSFEGRGFVAVLQSRMSFLRDYFQCSEKSQLKLYLLEFSGTVSWFGFSRLKPNWWRQEQSPVMPCTFFAKEKFCFCRHRFLHLHLNVYFLSSTNRFRIIDG